MMWPSQLDTHRAHGVDLILFVDDFLGSGTQAVRFFKSLPQHPAVWVYCPFVAYERGVNKLNSRFPRVSVVSAETLLEKHRLFSPDGQHFDDGVNTPSNAHAFYRTFLQKNGLDEALGAMAFGYSRLSMAVSFQHATPNATLPIFWSTRSSNRPLFER